MTRVALLPEENIAFGLFTNIDNGEIHGWVTNEVFSLFTSGAARPRAPRRREPMACLAG